MDAYCDARALCDSTRKQLKVSAGKWLSYIGEEHFASATPDMAVSWLNGPLATLKARTRYARSRSMRTVYACAVEAGTAASNPFDAPQVKALFKKGLALAAAQAGATGNEVLELVRQKKLSIADCEAFEGADAREAWQSVRLGTQDRFPIASGTATYQQIAEVLVSNRSSDWFDIDVMPDGTTLITPRLFPPC